MVQYRTLVLLGSRGEMKVGSVAAALDVHQSTATRLCDRLVAKGLVSRSDVRGEQTRGLHRVDTRGRALIRTVTTRRRREITKIMDHLQPGERARLVEAFRAFADAAGEVPDDAWKLGWTA